MTNNNQCGMVMSLRTIRRDIANTEGDWTSKSKKGGHEKWEGINPKTGKRTCVAVPIHGGDVSDIVVASVRKSTGNPDIGR